jgi:hypothetical protein
VLRVLIEVEDVMPAAAVTTAAACAAELARGGITARQLHHGYGLATYDVIRAAAAMDADVRIGLEDTTVLPDSTMAEGNGDLVAAAVRLVGAG